MCPRRYERGLRLYCTDNKKKEPLKLISKSQQHILQIDKILTFNPGGVIGAHLLAVYTATVLEATPYINGIWRQPPSLSLSSLDPISRVFQSSGTMVLLTAGWFSTDRTPLSNTCAMLTSVRREREREPTAKAPSATGVSRYARQLRSRPRTPIGESATRERESKWHCSISDSIIFLRGWGWRSAWHFVRVTIGAKFKDKKKIYFVYNAKKGKKAESVRGARVLACRVGAGRSFPFGFYMYNIVYTYTTISTTMMPPSH